MGGNGVVVVGDGGLLSWGLAFYLKQVGWGDVTVVGEAVAKEASNIRAVVDVHPPRLHNYMTLKSAGLHVWFRFLEATLGTDVPPQSMEVGSTTALSPSFLNWVARMPLYTREAKLLEHDVASAKLLQRQTTLISDLVAQNIVKGGASTAVRKGQLAPASPYADNVSDLFMERLSFGDQRFLLTELQKAGLKYTVSAAKGGQSGEWFPELFNIRQYIRGAVKYHLNVPDVGVIAQQLQQYCVGALGVAHTPQAVASFKTGADPTGAPGTVVTAAVLADGTEVPCDAVVLAAGADVPSLLLKAGCTLFPPLFQVAAFSLDVSTASGGNVYGTGKLPERNMLLESTLYFAKEKDTDKMRLSGLYSFDNSVLGTDWLSKSAKEPETLQTITNRWKTQLNLFAHMTLDPRAVEAAHIDPVALTPDGLPLIGKVADKGRFRSRPTNIYMCAGLGPAGVHQALSAAELAASLTIDARPEVPAAPFSPQRFWMSA